MSVRVITSSVQGEPDASVPEKPSCSIYNLLGSVLSCGTFASLMRGDVFVGVIEQAIHFSEQLFFGKKSGKIIPDKVFDACYGAVERILWHFNHLCSSTSSSGDSDRLSDFVKYFMTCGLVQMIGRFHTLQLENYCLARVRRSFQFTTWVSRILYARCVPFSLKTVFVHKRPNQCVIVGPRFFLREYSFLVGNAHWIEILTTQMQQVCIRN